MRDDLLGDTERPFGDGMCAIPECPMPANGLMCRYHWRQVPGPIAQRVLSELRAWNRNENTLGDLRDAQFAAVDAVAP